MEIKTAKTLINKDIKTLYTFMSDMNNIKSLLPAEKINSWSSTQDTCTFKINGMSDFGLAITEQDPPSMIKYSPYGKVPFAFDLTCHLTEITETSTEITFLFNGKINPIMQGLLKAPLTQFFNAFPKHLQNLYE